MSQMRERWPPQGLPGAILSGTLADRPAFGVAGRFYWATDEQMFYYDTGAAWEAPDHVYLENVLFDQHHDHFEEVITPLNSTFGGGVNSVANRAFGSPLYVKTPCQVVKLGLVTGSPEGGNFQIGLYDSAWNLVCATAALGVVASLPGAVRTTWFATTTRLP